MKIPFDIKYRPQIESGGYKVETRSGKKVRIVCWDRIGVPIVALIGDDEDIVMYDSLGTTGQQIRLPSDLFIITPEPELTEFEKALESFYNHNLQVCSYDNQGTVEDSLHYGANKLLTIVREELVRQGYVIEKKAFHDAVEKIDDKNKAEMSIQYSLHCKVENGTRRAAMNWESFQKLAQKFIDIGKAEALKNLPRWNSNPKSSMVDEAYVIGQWLYYKEHRIRISDLEKLPGFKED